MAEFRVNLSLLSERPLQTSKVVRLHLALFSLIALLPAGLPAQQTTGTIRGTVTDPTGGAIVGAKVTITNNETGVTRSAVTDLSGGYSVPLLRPGQYTVKTEAKGFTTALENDVLVRITETAVVNFSLQVGAVSESVTVQGAVSLVQTDSSSEGKLIEQSYLHSAAFAPAPRSRYGTLGRDTMRGPGVNLWDARISKVTPLTERVNLRFLTEFFNVWNHPAFANPATTLGTATFGTITSTVSNARIIQFALKLEY